MKFDVYVNIVCISMQSKLRFYLMLNTIVTDIQQASDRYLIKNHPNIFNCSVKKFKIL